MLSPFNAKALGFDLGNSRFFAEASKVAYTVGLGGVDPAANKLVATQLQIPVSAVSSFSFSGRLFATAGFVAQVGDAVVLSFRGTEPKTFDDWATDLNAGPVRFNWFFPKAPEIGEVHAGFANALTDAWPSIREAHLTPALRVAAGHEPKRLFITGHSLGGALAVLAAAVCCLEPDSLYPVAGVYTFGQPRVATHGAANTFDRLFGSRHYRFVNHADIVPRMPPRAFDYTHTGQAIHFSAPDGYALLEGPEHSTYFGKAFADLKSMGSFFKESGPEIQYHLLESKTGYLPTFETYLAAVAVDAKVRESLAKLFSA